MKAPEELTKNIELIKTGNKEAFTKVYEQSYPYLHTCVIHIVKDEDTAQDMLQETYVEIFKNIGQLKSSADFLSWAATIANRKCFAYLKKDRDILVDEQTDDEGKETDFFESLADDDAFIPENIFDNKEKIKIIRDIIDSLSDVQRACVIGFYYNEQKQDEIAKELGIPANTVKSHLNRAKAKIKDSVNDVEKKQDVKLYSIAPFMLLLFGHEAKEYAAKTAIPAMSGMTMAASDGAKVAGAAVKIKVLAAAIAGVAVIGGITGVALHHRSRPAPVVETVSEEVEAEPAVEPAATEAAEVTEETVSEEELQAALKEEYLAKIDACIEQEDYEAAYSLIKEGNEKLGGSDFDDKLTELPYAVANGVSFQTIDHVPGHLFIAFYEEKGGDIYRVTGPEFTYRDKDCNVAINGITMKNTGDGFKEYTITAAVDASYTVSHPVTDDKTYWFTDTPQLQFFDYYSGLCINTYDLSMYDLATVKSGDKESVVSWHGVDYPILITSEKKRNDPAAGEESEENGISSFKRNDHKDFTYTIRCPEDYDGLCVYLQDASQITDDTEEKRWNRAFDASGKFVEDTGAESSQIKYMFQFSDMDNEAHAPDFYLIMRVTDDLATAQPVAAQSTATVATTNATPATTATTTNAWLNIDPDCGYDGWADAYPTIDPDYDPTLYWTEEDWAIARSLRFE